MIDDTQYWVNENSTFFHMRICHRAAVRQNINPGSISWKNVLVLLYPNCVWTNGAFRSFNLIRGHVVEWNSEILKSPFPSPKVKVTTIKVWYSTRNIPFARHFWARLKFDQSRCSRTLARFQRKEELSETKQNANCYQSVHERRSLGIPLV